MDSFSRVISNNVRFGYGYIEIDEKLVYYAWHGYPNRNDDYITISEITKEEYIFIEEEYPKEISADSNIGDKFRSKYVDNHKVLLEGWNVSIGLLLKEKKMNIVDVLFKMQDKDYRKMQIKTIPTLDSGTVIGVRTPELRKLAKELYKSNNYKEFINDLPHKYFDENQLHAFIISEIKDYNECLDYVNKFLPYVDNWATCDQSTPKAFVKNPDKLIVEIKKWIKSKETYTIRFGIGMLMRSYLDDNFKEEYLEMVSKIRSNEYYVNMMIAWYFATALAKQYDSTIKYIEEKKLDTWTHNKTIQKAIESYRVSDEHKNYLRGLKIK